jgi:hypothetical protein
LEDRPRGGIRNERRKRVNTSIAALFNNAWNSNDCIGEVLTSLIRRGSEGNFWKDEIKGKTVTGPLSSNNKRSGN